MKKTNKSISLLLLLVMAVFSLTMASCSDDDSTGGGQPVITGVKILSTDTINYSYDSTYTKAGAGTMIAIMGNNLSGATKVTINDQEVYINPTMNTDHSIIVTIPAEADKDGNLQFKLSAFDSSIPDEIHVFTNHGDAVYAFKVTAPGPQLQRLEAVYPRNPGDEVKLYGFNLLDVQKAYITDAQSAALDTTVWTTAPGRHYDIDLGTLKSQQDHKYDLATKSYRTNSVLSLNLPAEVPDSGTLVLECAAGKTYIAFSKLPGKPVITSVSNDMPEIGEDLIITGREFVQVESITYGDVTLTSSDFTVAESQDTITVPFKKKPTAGSGTTLTITTVGGQVSSPYFYDPTTILTTFDGDAADEGWGPNAKYVDANNADGKYAYIQLEEAQQWWGTMIFFKKDWNGNNFTLSDNIPADADINDIYFAYNVYDAGDYNNGTFLGYLRYTLWPNSAAGQEGSPDNYQYDNFGWPNYEEGIGNFPDGPVLQDVNGVNHKNKWYRAVVPVSKFPAYAGMKTYGEFKNAGVSIFRMQSINQSTTKGNIDTKFDNVRIVYIPSK